MVERCLRRDPLHKVWVVFAPEKVDTIIQKSAETDAKFDIDPFVPGLEYATGKEILRRVNPAYANKSWSSRVFPAKKPILKVENDKNNKGMGLYDVMSRVGAHEVVVETPKNDVHFDQLLIEEIADVIAIIRDRVADLKKDSRFRYILVSKNRGRFAGGTINHNYSEIKALPFVPPVVQYKLNNCKEYYLSKERCLLCDIIDQELFDRKRVITENDLFIAFSPYASRYPFETMIVPRKHKNIFDGIDDNEIKEFAKIIKAVLYKLRVGLNSPAYNAVFHYQSVNNASDAELESKSYHWHVIIIPRISIISSDMLESGVYLNPTLPEKAANFLKNIRELN